MIKCFFDTSAYNNLTDSCLRLIREKIDEKVIEIYSTGGVVSELCKTFEYDAKKAKYLLGLFEEFNLPRIVNAPAELVKSEITAVVNGDKIPELSETLVSLQDNLDIQRKFNNLKEGKIDPEDQNAVDLMFSSKKQQKKDLIKIYKDVDPAWKANLDDPILESFEGFFMSRLKKGVVEEILKLAIDYLFGDKYANVQKKFARKKTLKRLNKLPYTRAYLRLTPSLVYWYHKVRKQRPNHGDLVDAHIRVTAAEMDHFIAADTGTVELANLMINKNCGLRVPDFINLISKL